MSILRRRPKDAPPRRDRSEEFASFKPEPVPAVMARHLDSQGPVLKLAGKVPRNVRTIPKLRDSANGEECTVRIVGACNGRTDTTVLAHLPSLDGDRGMALKSIDYCAAFACAGCHDVIDGRKSPPPGASATSVLLDFYRGHMRTLVRWMQKGLL